MGFFSNVFGKKFGGGLDNFANKTLINPIESIVNNTTNNINKVHDAGAGVIVGTGNALNRTTGAGAGLAEDAGKAGGDIMKQMSQLMPYAAMAFGAIVLLQVLPTILPQRRPS